jgi:putative transcriptional regulator
VRHSQGAREAAAYAKGEMDDRAIRARLDLSQKEFAARYGFGLARVRDWEQGRSRPDGALRAYLKIIEHKPKAVDEALSAA